MGDPVMINFHDLYTQHAGDIYCFALFLSGDTAQAADITAETFARVLTTDTPLAEATVKGYLLTTARNLFIETQRRGRKHATLTPELPDPRPQLEDVVSQRSELDAVRNHMQGFPEVDRTALLLCAHGFSYDEIAQTLSISLASAKVKVHRLRLKLAEWRANRDSS
jgi:RNA polymerase sigma-70 factor (ECF subfamily)